MTELTSEQFRGHMEEFHRQLGVEFGPGHVAVGGSRIPTSRQTIAIQGTPAGTHSYLYAGVPAESGRIHSMSARLIPGAGASQSAIDMNVGRHKHEGSAWLQPGHGNPEMESPEKFASNVHGILSRSETPTPAEREHSSEHLKASASTRHLIHVEHTPDLNARTRRYHFDHGTGMLTEA